ncbi:hypothetical protein TNCT_564401 [Trichonephila clavata]|uniref:Uncharacterized protein n=1 Tax=Trichonephila clavata TaxID=2740835 RepID=A0A8X6LBZ3_TRICU|nr:hypothetical protein TNCT_564401 [Trichonephila clavata]
MSFEKTLSRSQYRFSESKRIASLLDEFGALATVAPAPKCQWHFSERIKGGNPGGFSGKAHSKFWLSRTTHTRSDRQGGPYVAATPRLTSNAGHRRFQKKMVGGVRRLRCPCRHPSDVAHRMVRKNFALRYPLFDPEV